MKLILLIFSILFLTSCSTHPPVKADDNDFEKFFSVSGLTDMKTYDKLGSIETPIDIKVINKINENKNWQENLQNVFPDGYWVFDGEKLIHVK